MVTAVIAHEFNNILTPMISYTKFALGDKADEALRQKALAKALSGSERLANISKSLLGFARGDDTSSVPVLLAVRETLGCLARDLSKDGITLTLDVPAGFPRDAFESNDTLATATDLGPLGDPMTVSALTIHTAIDEDWFTFTTLATGTATSTPARNPSPSSRRSPT